MTEIKSFNKDFETDHMFVKIAYENLKRLDGKEAGYLKAYIFIKDKPNDKLSPDLKHNIFIINHEDGKWGCELDE